VEPGQWRHIVTTEAGRRIIRYPKDWPEPGDQLPDRDITPPEQPDLSTRSRVNRSAFECYLSRQQGRRDRVGQLARDWRSGQLELDFSCEVVREAYGEAWELQAGRWTFESLPCWQEVRGLCNAMGMESLGDYRDPRPKQASLF